MPKANNYTVDENASICWPYFGGPDCLELPLVRLGGAGLGNLLFPWARAVVAAEKYSLRLMYPTWLSLKLGCYVRRERDKRHYANLFQPSDRYIHGFDKYWNQFKMPKVAEEVFISNPEYYLKSPHLIQFERDNRFFSSILKNHSLVRESLFEITKNRNRNALTYDFTDTVSVHVRLGDYTIPSSYDEVRRGVECLRAPLSWYAECIVQLKKSLGGQTKFLIISDGLDSELAPLLQIDGVHRISFGNALADLLALTFSKVLIANGSTFSYWASYLGRMPVIWPLGQLRQRLYENDEAEIELEEGNMLPPGFIASINNQSRHNK